jgi:hypothetical protein
MATAKSLCLLIAAKTAQDFEKEIRNLGKTPPFLKLLLSHIRTK